jgi:putative methionine-R-sulfoxide reductase with GAF domain
VSGYSGAYEAIDQIVSRGNDADDALRQVVAVLYDRIDQCSWVGISFVEEDKLVLGPALGQQNAEPTAIPISYEDNVVAELGVVASGLGTEDRTFLERVAVLISPYCLVGWDTGGEAWAP